LGYKSSQILHKIAPDILGQISGGLAECGLNIIDMISKSRGNYACTLAKIGGDATNVGMNIGKIEGVTRVRVI